MGGIFGIRYFDNRPINDSDIDTLKSAMAHWGPDGSTVWKSDGIALGHLLLYNTPEALFEDQPLQAGPLTMVAEARIDNRAELARRLEIPSSELKEMSDSLLIFRAFQKWGKRCVDYLLGDWSFALWDAETKELFVGRDHHGITGVHYYYDKNRLVFASSLPALLEIDWVPKKPNLEYVARVLVSWGKFGHETAFENILRLPPAHYAKIKQSSVQLEFKKMHGVLDSKFVLYRFHRRQWRQRRRFSENWQQSSLARSHFGPQQSISSKHGYSML